ncbi:hypothetical protein PVAP13_9NG282173 [Panicum virgatum]|uniref:Uncharacterized protein n=1 Tax=Panicum virgatum TaxID=38727 RepID=A0A8T0MCM3_PANVG|nr:hypothetical protein PVAP13_9NG282173 [Panicum virgatum]
MRMGDTNILFRSTFPSSRGTNSVQYQQLVLFFLDDHWGHPAISTKMDLTYILDLIDIVWFA